MLLSWLKRTVCPTQHHVLLYMVVVLIWIMDIYSAWMCSAYPEPAIIVIALIGVTTGTASALNTTGVICAYIRQLDAPCPKEPCLQTT